jgi:hypothetical protein
MANDAMLMVLLPGSRFFTADSFFADLRGRSAKSFETITTPLTTNKFRLCVEQELGSTNFCLFFEGGGGRFSYLYHQQ